MTQPPDRDISRGEAVDLAEEAMSRIDLVLDKAWTVGNKLHSAAYVKKCYAESLGELTHYADELEMLVNGFDTGKKEGKS